MSITRVEDEDDSQKENDVSHRTNGDTNGSSDARSSDIPSRIKLWRTLFSMEVTVAIVAVSLLCITSKVERRLERQAADLNTVISAVGGKASQERGAFEHISQKDCQRQIEGIRDHRNALVLELEQERNHVQAVVNSKVDLEQQVADLNTAIKVLMDKGTQDGKDAEKIRKDLRWQIERVQQEKEALVIELDQGRHRVSYPAVVGGRERIIWDDGEITEHLVWGRRTDCTVIVARYESLWDTKAEGVLEFFVDYEGMPGLIRGWRQVVTNKEEQGTPIVLHEWGKFEGFKELRVARFDCWSFHNGLGIGYLDFWIDDRYLAEDSIRGWHVDVFHPSVTPVHKWTVASWGEDEDGTRNTEVTVAQFRSEDGRLGANLKFVVWD